MLSKCICIIYIILTVPSCNVHGCASKKELIPEPQALVAPLIAKLQSKTGATENCLRIIKVRIGNKKEIEWMVDFLGTRIGVEEDLVLNSAFKITVVEQQEFLKLKMIINYFVGYQIGACENFPLDFEGTLILDIF